MKLPRHALMALVLGATSTSFIAVADMSVKEVKEIAAVGDNILKREIHQLRQANNHRDNAQSAVDAKHWKMIKDLEAGQVAQDEFLKEDQLRQDKKIDEAVSNTYDNADHIVRNQGRISSVENRLNDNDARVSIVEDSVAQTNGRVSSIEDSVAQTNGRVDDVKDSVVQTNQHVDANTQAIKHTNGRVSVVESGLYDVIDRVGVTEQRITQAEAELYSTTYRSHANSKRLDAVESDVSWLKSENQRHINGIATAAAIGGLNYPDASEGAYAVGVNITNYRNVNAFALGAKGEKNGVLLELAVGGTDNDGFNDVIIQGNASFAFGE